jgi:hypothetical protein
MQLRYSFKRDPRPNMKTIGVLGDKVFDLLLSDETGYDHMGKRGTGEVDQLVYRHFVGLRL